MPPPTRPRQGECMARRLRPRRAARPRTSCPRAAFRAGRARSGPCAREPASRGGPTSPAGIRSRVPHAVDVRRVEVEPSAGCVLGGPLTDPAVLFDPEPVLEQDSVAHADCSRRPVVVVVAGALSLDPADEPDVEIRVAVELLVEAGVGVVADEVEPEVLVAASSAARCGHRRTIEIRVGRERGREARQRARSSQQRRRCVRLENVSHSIAETADGIQCRPRVDDWRVAPIGELVHAEGLDEELDRSSPVRGDVEERVRIERRADVDAAVGEPLELERSLRPRAWRRGRGASASARGRTPSQER